jgi:hypothetical protein
MTKLVFVRGGISASLIHAQRPCFQDKLATAVPVEGRKYSTAAAYPAYGATGGRTIMQLSSVALRYDCQMKQQPL